MVSHQGALRRAFFSRVDGRLLAAVLLSVVLHSALLPLHLLPRRELPSARPEIQVRFAGHALARTVAKAPVLRREISPRTETASRRPPATNAMPERPPVTGMAIPQQLPIPFPGKRPLWSFDAPQTANAQAAYQAQAQQQARQTMLAQMQSIRLQYEALLALRMSNVESMAPCRIVLSDRGQARFRCSQSADAEHVAAVLREMGNPPAIEVAYWLLMTLAPGRAGEDGRVAESRVAQDPGL
jgi:hypothetical protein